MAATTGQLGLVTPTQGTLSGTWGNTVNNGITEYTNIAIAGTLSFTGDGAITLANTTGDAAATNITTTTAQYMVIRVTGTLTTPKIITGPSYSKIYLVDHAATGSTVTFKAAGQSGVSIAISESCFVYYNGTDYIKVASDLITTLSGTLSPANGGTGVANNAASTLTISGNFPTTLTVAASTSVALPASGSLGYLNIPQNSQSTAYTTVLADAGTTIFHPASDANARTFTIAANSSVAYVLGTVIQFINMSASAVTIACNTDTLTWAQGGSSGSRTLAQYGVANVVKVGTTQWLLTGTNVT